MKRSRRFVLCAVLTAGAAAPLAAQQAPPASPTLPGGPATGGIPQAAKDATSLSAADRTAIQTFVNTQVQRLTSPEALAVSTAREALVNEIPTDRNGKAKCTPTFADFYAESLNTAILKLLPQLKDVGRLNASIVVARIAEPANSSQLKDAAAKLVADQYQPAVLWGLRAAKFVLPPVLSSPILSNDVTLRDAIPKSVALNDKGVLAGDIAREAYDALTLDSSNPNSRIQITPQMFAGVVPQVHKLLRQRVDAYRLGIPANPDADQIGVNFLINPSRWPNLTKPQKLETVQLLSDMLTLAADQAAAAKNPTLQAQVSTAVDRIAQSIAIVAGYADVNAPAVVTAANAVAAKGVAAAQKAQLARQVLPALKQVKDFAGLKNPPAVTGNAEPTTEPTTLPTTTTAPSTKPAAPAANAPTAPAVPPATPAPTPR
jgi:hypothetical protein